VDDAGHLLYFVRLDGTFTGSPNIAIGKARTAALFKKATGDFENIVNKGRFSMTALPPDFTPLQGGVPIKHGDEVIGAIGVSGAQSAAQDEEIARAGAAALEKTKTARN
ncbi:MAG: heme-binding protein, partial [Verrucomicrobiota bacterium]